MIYLVCFAASAALAYFANKTNNKKLFYVFSAVSIAIMVLLAGLRDFSIGIDTENYLNKSLYWDGAIKSATLTDYIYKYVARGYGEPLFALLVGVVAQFTGNYSVFLVLIHLIIIGCVYIGAFRLRKYVNPAMILIIFYLFFFNHSLNVLRQYVAMSIIFAFFADILNKKYLKFCLAVILALQFHTISLVAFGLVAPHIILYHPKMPGKLVHREIGLVAALSVAVLGFSPLVHFVIRLGLLNKRYLFIFDKNKIEPAIIIAMMVAVGIAAAFYFRKEMRAKCEQYDYFFMCSVCYFILLMLTFSVASSKRIAINFGLADIATLALVQSSQTKRIIKILVTVGIIGMALVYWVYVYYLRNASETLPYILGV